MPIVEVTRRMTVGPGEAWTAVADVRTYPQRMANVQSVEVLAEERLWRRVAWSVLLRGSVLQWVGQERLDPPAGRLSFEQESGDLERFRGHWTITPEAGGGCSVWLLVDFEIGIPLLAQMLHPIAEAALRDNALEMMAAFGRTEAGRGTR